MSFISFSFLIFYLVVLCVRGTIGVRGDGKAYLGALLVFSLIFYGWHVPRYLWLILASTAIDYLAVRALARLPPGARSKRLGVLSTAIVANLGLLAYFKYARFLVEQLAALARATGFGDVHVPAFEIVLPIGISFYTFQSMSYTIDVYRGRLRPEPSFLRFALYVAFFPQLVAGPIVRAGDFLYQLSRKRRLRLRVFLAGTYLIVRGLFLKMVVADNLAVVVDKYWGSAAKAEPSGTLPLSLAVFFSCQLFADFAGYTDIARGVAYQLGFRLPINFNAPYIASTFTELWRRWHISLSQWMRDYLYIPLGGNRCGRARAYANLFIVMALCGLWHGASWTFVAWGALHGVAVAVERMLGIPQRRRRHLNPVGRASRVGRLAAAAVWFLVVQATWIAGMAIFRAASIDEAWAVLTGAIGAIPRLGVDGLAYAPSKGVVSAAWWFTLPVWTLHARALLAERIPALRPSVYERAVYAGAMTYLILTLYATGQGFIYFQF